MKKNKKILTVIGTRPQLIKLVPDLKGQVIVWTGQHYDKNMVKVLNVPKFDYNLTSGVNYGIGMMIDSVINIINKEKPDYVMVIGDCRTTVAGAIAAHQTKTKLIHLEAGCRCDNMDMIEERNRILVDSLSDVLLAPSKNCADNLAMEGYDMNKIHIVGASQLYSLLKMCPTKKWVEGDYDVLTLHRDFNVDDKVKLKRLLTVLGKDKYDIYFPIHPRTRKNLGNYKLPKNIKLIDPLPYKEMIHLIGYAKRVITDSGGLQVEAYCLGTPCITLRNETEWEETVDEGWNVLVGDNENKILDALNRFGMGSKPYNSMAYGRKESHNLIKSIIDNL